MIKIHTFSDKKQNYIKNDFIIYTRLQKWGENMKLLKTIVNKMIVNVKKSDYNCSPAGFYKPQK